MQRRVFFLVGLLLVAPVLAQASTISLLEPVNLLPNTPGQVITLQITGSDYYTDSNLRVSFNGAVGASPVVELVFNDPDGAIPAANLAGSVWTTGGAGGIAGAPNGTTSSSIGANTSASFITPGFVPQNTAGVYATLTLSTVDAPPGLYWLYLTGTELFNDLDPETFEPIPVPLTADPIPLFTPEPSSLVLGLFAAASIAAAVIRRRRAV